MLFNNILVPYDGSDHSKRAFALAGQMLEDNPEAKVHILQVVTIAALDRGADPYGFSAGEDAVPMAFAEYEQYKANMDKVFEESKNALIEELGGEIEDLGDRVVLKIEPGTVPAPRIIEYAEENAIDLIIMGRRGLGAFRSLLGSVSMSVLHEAEIPVLTIK